MMKKIYNVSLFFTSVFVYIAWHILNGVNLSFIDSLVMRHIVLALAEFIAAYGFFHLFASFIVALSEKISFVKRIILGSTYIEGVWIGYYNVIVEEKESIVYFKEIMSQTLDNILINGESCYHDGTSRAYWSSNGVVKINSSNKTLAFIYNLDTSLDDFESIPQNLGVEHLHLQYGKKSFPISYKGFSSNICDNYRSRIIAKKITGYPSDIETKDWFDQAKEFYDSSHNS